MLYAFFLLFAVNSTLSLRQHTALTAKVNALAPSQTKDYTPRHQAIRTLDTCPLRNRYASLTSKGET